VFSWGIAIGQNYDEQPFLKFKNISGSLGDPGDFARFMIQDKHGFIWVSTDVSFKSFDGYNFKEYFLNKDDVYALILFEDHLGNIWTFAGPDGMYQLDRKKDVVTRYQIGKINYKGNLGIFPNVLKCMCMFEDKYKKLWVSTYDGYYCFDPSSKKIILPKPPHKDYAAWVYKGRDGENWEVLTSGIRLFNAKNNSIIPFRDSLGKQQYIKDFVTLALEDKTGILWFTTLNDGLYRFDKSSKILTHYNHNPKNSFSLSDDGIPYEAEDSKGRLWFATEKGLDLLDKKSNRFYHYRPNFRNADALDRNPILIFEDIAKGLWVSHLFGGISYVGGYSKPFRNYYPNIGDPKSLSYPFVSSFFERTDGNIFMTTSGGGLNLWNRKEDYFKHLSYPTANITNNDRLGFIFEDKKGNLWIQIREGIKRYNQNTKNIKIYENCDLFAYGQSGEIWVFKQDGLYKYNYDKDNFILTFPNAEGFAQDKKGNFWIGIPQKGLCKYDLGSKKILDCIKAKGYRMAEDSKGNFWMLLLPHGDTLVKYNPNTHLYSDTVTLHNKMNFKNNILIVDN
jgi:ligand-binding sensor domain-containing protein